MSVTSAPRAAALLGDGEAHLAARAIAEKPTGSKSSSVGPAVTTSARRRGHEIPRSLQQRASRGAIAAGSAIRPMPTSPEATSPLNRTDEGDAALRRELRDVPLRRRMIPHPRMHRGGRDHRPSRAERERSDEIVRRDRAPAGRAHRPSPGTMATTSAASAIRRASRRRTTRPTCRRDGSAADARQRDAARRIAPRTAVMTGSTRRPPSREARELDGLVAPRCSRSRRARRCGRSSSSTRRLASAARFRVVAASAGALLASADRA